MATKKIIEVQVNGVKVDIEPVEYKPVLENYKRTVWHNIVDTGYMRTIDIAKDITVIQNNYVSPGAFEITKDINKVTAGSHLIALD